MAISLFPRTVLCKAGRVQKTQFLLVYCQHLEHSSVAESSKENSLRQFLVAVHNKHCLCQVLQWSGLCCTRETLGRGSRGRIVYRPAFPGLHFYCNTESQRDKVIFPRFLGWGSQCLLCSFHYTSDFATERILASTAVKVTDVSLFEMLGSLSHGETVVNMVRYNYCPWNIRR